MKASQEKTTAHIETIQEAVEKFKDGKLTINQVREVAGLDSINEDNANERFILQSRSTENVLSK